MAKDKFHVSLPGDPYQIRFRRDWDPGPISTWHRNGTGKLLPGYTYTDGRPGGTPCLSYRPPKPDLVTCPDCGALMSRMRLRCRVCKSKLNERIRVDQLKALKDRHRNGSVE